jgi:hypothetical protein
MLTLLILLILLTMILHYYLNLIERYTFLILAIAFAIAAFAFLASFYPLICIRGWAKPTPEAYNVLLYRFAYLCH